MAISLSATLSLYSLQPNRNANHRLARVFPDSSPNRDLKRCKIGIIFPLRQSYTVASAISVSPGIESSVVSEDTGNLLDTVKVFDLNGNGIPISDLWKDRKAVVAFARHFGCVLCRKRADYLASKKDVMDASGVALVLIGPGSIDQAGLKIIQSYIEGYRQDWKLSSEKDTMSRGGWQQGGILIAGPGKNNISYIHKDKEAGDDPDIEDILKACCS